MYNSSSLANAPVSVLPHEIPMRCYPVVRRRCIDPLNNSARGACWRDYKLGKSSDVLFPDGRSHTARRGRMGDVDVQVLPDPACLN